MVSKGNTPHISRNHFTSRFLRDYNLPRIPASSSCGSSFSRYAGFQNHGKVVYLKEVSEESPEAITRITHRVVSGVGSFWLPSYPKRFCFSCEAFYLYFWSEDVPDFQGWWFGPQEGLQSGTLPADNPSSVDTAPITTTQQWCARSFESKTARFDCSLCLVYLCLSEHPAEAPWDVETSVFAGQQIW